MKTVKSLRAGDLIINHDCEKNVLHNMLDVAQRKNPKRPFLFVSKVLGRHYPVKPSVMNECFKELAEKALVQLNASEHYIASSEVLTIGMAETAVGLGAGVHDCLVNDGVDSLYFSTTRYPQEDTPVFCEFKEEHSHAKSHFLHCPAEYLKRVQSTKVLVLVDDEASTGNTFKNLINSLIRSGLTNLQKIITVTITDWSNNAIKDLLKSGGATQYISLSNINMLSGSFEWRDNGKVDLEQHANAINKNDVSDYCDVDIPDNECRLGMLKSKFVIPALPELSGSILVVGTGEFAWQPYLIAKHLEDSGLNVFFSSTSRSPIYEGGVIRHKVELHDNYAQNIDMFAYNIDASKYEHILFCTETKASLFDQALLRSMPNAEVIHCE